MSHNDTLCIYIQFPILKKEYECRVNLDNHFHDILEQIFILKIQDFSCIYQLSDIPIIQCIDTNQYCISNESLRTLRVKDGMTFKVYSEKKAGMYQKIVSGKVFQKYTIIIAEKRILMFQQFSLLMNGQLVKK